MNHFGLTSAEIALEMENKQLKARIYELERKLPLFEPLQFGPSAPTEIELGKNPHEFELKCIATIDSRITPDFGMEVLAWGGSGATKLWNQYYISRDNYMAIKNWSPLAPRILDYLHRDFIERLASYALSAKKKAHV